MYGISIKNKTHNLRKLENRLRKLSKANVSSGYFSDSGTHSSYHINYAELMYMHETGFEGEYGFIPSRPVRLQTSMYMANTYSAWSKSIGDYLFRGKKVDYPLDLIGRLSAQFATDLFGDSVRLESNSEITQEQKGGDNPLVDTGELRDNWGYRNSFDKTIVKVSWG